MSAIPGNSLRIIDSDGETAGGAWLAKADTIVTCAHVVNAALDRCHLEQTRPSSDKYIKVVIPREISTSEETDLLCEISEWMPPIEKTKRVFTGDIAILKPVKPISSSDNYSYHLASNPIIGSTFYCWGFPEGYPRGRSSEGKIGGSAGDRFELKKSGDNILPSKGFSGCPVYSTNRVVGIITTARDDGQASYIVPLSELAVGSFKPELETEAEVKFPHVTPTLQYLDKLDRRKDGSRFDSRVKVVGSPAVIDKFIGGSIDEKYTDQALSPNALFKTLENKKVSLTILSAPGGYGKSHYLIDISRILSRSGKAWFWLDLSKPTTDVDLPGKLFDETVLYGNYERVKQLSNEGWQIFVIADGLNESASNRSNILKTLSNMSKSQLINIVVGNRLERFIEGNDYEHAVMCPLPQSVVMKHVTSYQELPIETKFLLSSPFFLTLHEKVSLSSDTRHHLRYKIFYSYFTDLVIKKSLLKESKAPSNELIESKLKDLATGAFTIYQKHMRPSVSKEGWYKAGFEDSLLNALIHAGSVQCVGSELYTFTHQLFHDWLAAYYIAQTGPAVWNNANFDVITLKKASTDSILLAAEASAMSNQLRDFLISLYDWDYKTVLQILVEKDVNETSPTESDITNFRDSIFALNALRASDIFQHSRNAVSGYLKAYSAIEDSLKFGVSPTESDVIDVYSKKYMDGTEDHLVSKFRDILLGPDTQDLSGKEKIEFLENILDGPFIGWATVSKLRLSSLPQDMVQSAIAMYSCLSRSSTIDHQESIGARWRLVHLLGRADNSLLAREKLFAVLQNQLENHWVHYGAARSLMELAFRAQEDSYREKVIENLSEIIADIDSKTVRGELLRTTSIADKLDKPANWNGLCIKLVEARLRKALDIDEDEERKWKVRLRELKQ